ncbi:3-hydroxybutyrate dehydrogenase [Marinobacterium arenosum]|uniref:3-hydroxybutyrate dehydrogenase n=1 Tax=Marinobacterium arenosum TaxID=2862496 RepID=UPI001C96DF10|nr:3-hydroxybutyrate dehydrogenase [Marinobacterium arenosum]MBY4676958.1 3-hydroxybutyrate dehydrogenase [Marinobacterium arenosum]
MLNQKVVLVTGSSSGIGLAIARTLAEQGARIMMHGLEAEAEGNDLAEELATETGAEVRYCSANLMQPSEVERLVDTTIEQFGRLDVLVNNAGIQYTAPVSEFPADKWDAIIAINLSAAFHATRRALPLMARNGWGRIINIASVHGLVASAEKSAYCAAKHGLVGFTKVVAMETAEQGITANCICPGWTDTPLLNDQIARFAEQHGQAVEDARLGLVKAKAPYPEMVQPAAIGALALYLCSDAAKAMTGTALPIDGGWTAH